MTSLIPTGVYEKSGTTVFNEDTPREDPLVKGTILKFVMQ